MSLLGLLLIILLIGAIFGYGRTTEMVWIVLAVILVFALFGNYAYVH